MWRELVEIKAIFQYQISNQSTIVERLKKSLMFINTNFDTRLIPWNYWLSSLRHNLVALIHTHAVGFLRITVEKTKRKNDLLSCCQVCAQVFWKSAGSLTPVSASCEKCELLVSVLWEVLYWGAKSVYTYPTPCCSWSCPDAVTSDLKNLLSYHPVKHKALVRASPRSGILSCSTQRQQWWRRCGTQDLGPKKSWALNCPFFSPPPHRYPWHW